MIGANWQMLLNILYILSSAVLVLLPLVAVIPRWLKVVPFYRRAVYGVNKILVLKEDEEFRYPSAKPVKLMVGYVRKGERGFSELLQAIKAKEQIRLTEVRRIGLAWGDIPIKTPLNYTPCCALFVAEEDTGEVKGYPQFLNRFTGHDTFHIKHTLLDWIKSKVQVRIATYTFIVAVTWVTLMTLVIYS